MSEGCQRLRFFRSFSFMLHAINLIFNFSVIQTKRKKFDFSFQIYLHPNRKKGTDEGFPRTRSRLYAKHALKDISFGVIS